MNLNTLLCELTALPSEVEWVEFKCNNKNPEEMGEYLSALAWISTDNLSPKQTLGSVLVLAASELDIT